jgi:ABC-2 type transport system ATP-binding protein
MRKDRQICRTPLLLILPVFRRGLVPLARRKAIAAEPPTAGRDSPGVLQCHEHFYAFVSGPPFMLIATHQLTKCYGNFPALADCSLAVRPGEVFGLLGPNGAGKTTLLRLLLGFIRPTSGRGTIAGLDCVRDSLAVREKTVYLPGEARLFRRMNGRQVLDFFCRLRPSCRRDEAERVARRLDLDLSRQVARMSTGMRQKLALAAVLATDAELVILDEPTANLDPTARGEVLELVREVRGRGRTVVFSSHVLSEVEETCDSVAILRAGRLVHEQQIAEIRRSHRITARMKGPLGEVPAALAGQVRVVASYGSGVVLEAAESLAALLGWLATLAVEEVLIEPVGLSAVYDRFHREHAHDAGTNAALARLAAEPDRGPATVRA